jgi:alpha-mannosidase
VQPEDVLVTALKPSDDGRALIVRLFNAGKHQADATLAWSRNTPRRMLLSDTGERPVRELLLDDCVAIPASGLVVLRAEFAE